MKIQKIFNYIKENKNVLIQKTYNSLSKKIDDSKISISLLNKKIKSLNKTHLTGKNIKDFWKQIDLSLLIQNAQDRLEKSFKNNNEDLLLKQSQFWMRRISWTLMGSTVFGISWLAIAKTEEIVIATGQLEPISRVANVQMPLQGIADEILVEEGQKVKKGQTLIRLDTESTQSKQEGLKERLKLSEIILEKLEFLAEQGAIPEIQYLEQKSKVSQLKTELTQTNVILRYQEIIAPTSGVIFDLKPRRAGYVARSSEPVLKIVPFDNLRAKVEINNRSIGFVSVGKKADISIASFPASDFGVIEGTVTSIGSDALPPDRELRNEYKFPAIITLDSQNLVLQNGQKLPLQVGMSLTANIKLRKVTYLQLLLTTFRDKASSLKEI